MILDWQNIETVLLDMDGTLLDLRFDNYFWRDFLPERYAEVHGFSLHEAKDFVHLQIQQCRGTLDWYCLDYWSRQLQMDVSALKHELRHHIALRPQSLQFLRALRQAGKRVLLATNAHHAGLTIKLRETGIEIYFDACYSAHQFGFPKEAQDFWHALHAVADFDKQRSLFIDDNEQVLIAARIFGIGHLLSIRQPDSSEPARTPGEFHLLGDFAELLPID